MLVFGVMPSLGKANANLPDQHERFQAMKAARQEAKTIIAEKLLARVLNANVPPSASSSLNTGHSVMVFI